MLLLSSCGRTPSRSSAVLPLPQLYSAAQASLLDAKLDIALKQSEEGLQRSVQGNATWNFKFAVLKAETLTWMGQPKTSLDSLPQSAPPSGIESEFPVRAKLAEVHALGALSRFSDAEHSLRQAEQLVTASAPELSGDVALERGTLALRQGHDQTALEMLQTALAQSRLTRRRLLETEALGETGWIYTRLQRYGQGIDWSTDALNLSRKTNIKLPEPGILVNLGWSKLGVGDLEGAKPYFTDAEALAESRGLLSYQADAFANLGQISFELKDYPGAAGYYEKALNSYRAGSYNSKVAMCLIGLAEVAFKAGDAQQAENYMRQARALLTEHEDSFERNELDLLDAEMSENKDPEKARRILDTIINFSPYPSQKWTAEAQLAHVYVLTGKSHSAAVEFVKVLSTLDSARATLTSESNKLAFSSRESEFYKNYVEFLVAEGRPVDAFLVADRIRARTLSEGLSQKSRDQPEVLTLARLQSVLSRHKQVLISYWLAPKRSFAWLVTPARVQIFQLPGSEILTPKIKAYAEAIPEGKGIADPTAQDGQELYNLFVRPWEKLIPSDSDIVIVPDAALAMLNFETLIVPGPAPHYWIDDVTLENAPSASLIASTSQTRRPHEQLLAIGDAVNESGSPTLVNAGAEIREVAQDALPGQEVIVTGKAAIPSSYPESHPERFHWIHFAAHGTSNQIDPLESAIVLSPQAENLNKLYGRDIVKTKLNADLVTISSCLGAKGRIYGEGSVGLAWAFMRAGARHVVAALWNLDDASALQMMKIFYKDLSRGKSAAAALHHAKIVLKQDGSHQRPYYWASLQLYVSSQR